LVLPWHCAQSPVVGCAASATEYVLAVARGRVWKPVYCAPGVSTLGEIGYALCPIQVRPVSWQATQPDVTPVWICPVVGAGVANFVPGAVFVAAAGTGLVGVVARWQVSHVVEDGMCELAPAGDVAGITTILVTPTKLEPVTPGPWQATQLLAMPVWLISEPEKCAPLGTGSTRTLEPVPTWQASHDAVVGTWFDGSPTIEKLAAGIAKLGAAEPWHWAQFVVVLGAFAWMLATVGMTEKSLDVWQAEHGALVAVGMWFAGLSTAVK
jgi:hypothetical protein